MVADCLEELKSDGFRVFHDVPCLGGGGCFNLDHVVVGNGAVTVIETKTRRKHSPDGGGPDHEVSFNGTALLWPRGPDSQPVEQTLRSAEWLEKRLKIELNITVRVYPILAIPGWFVREGPNAPVFVTRANALPNVIRNLRRSTLTPEQQDLVIRHLTSLCRDVDFDSIG